MGRPKGSKNKKCSSEATLTCAFCNSAFVVKNYRRKVALYCSHQCYAQDIPKKYSGSNNPHWKGGKHKTWNGYIIIKNSSHPRANSRGYIRRSHLIMESHIGKYLTPEEVVHHINGIRDDDRIENFMLFPSQTAHRRFHAIL